MIFQSILLIATGIVLFYASKTDIEKHKIYLNVLVVIALFGLGFIIINSSNLLYIAFVELLIVMFFFVGVLFGMGIGDMFLLLSLGLFIDERAGVFIFIGGLMVFAFIWMLYEIDQRNAWKKIDTWASINFPMIPSIAFGFWCYIIFLLSVYIQELFA